MSLNRSQIIKISNDDEYRCDFPLELTHVDYLRRILNHVGGAFLVAQHRVADMLKSDMLLNCAIVIASKEEEAEAEASPGIMSPDEECADSPRVDLSRPASPQGRHAIQLTSKSLSKLLSKLIDEQAKSPRDANQKQRRGSTKKQDKRLKKETKRQQAYQLKQTKLRAAWGSTINREPSWIVEKAIWLKFLKRLIESTEMIYSTTTDNQIKQSFETSIDLLIVLSEAVEGCQWYLSNVQQLRSQFIRHIKSRRERFHAEEVEERKSRGGTGDEDENEGPKTNEDGSFQFNFCYDFDQNGVLYWFGTGAGANESKEDEKIIWENPAISQKIRAFRSSDGAGLASDICGRERGRYSCTDYRQPRQYYGVDFGSYYRFYPSAYTLRHGSSQGILALRDWTVEGSQDGKKWFPVRKHRADEELPRLAYSTHTWKIEKQMQRKCRMIRIVQTRPVDVAQRLNDASGKQNNAEEAEDGNKKHPRHHALFLSGMELYGKLVEV